MPHTAIPDILTGRLALIALTPEIIRAEQSSGPRFAELVRCTIPANWPPEHWDPHVFDFLLALFDRDPEALGWTRFVAIRKPDGTRTLAGTVGGFAREDPAECEIGYSILQQFEGLGLITEAAQAFIQRIRATGRFSSIIAHTYPWLGGSIRVMEKCGLTYDGPGQEQGTIRYRMRL